MNMGSKKDRARATMQVGMGVGKKYHTQGNGKEHYTPQVHSLPMG